MTAHRRLEAHNPAASPACHVRHKSIRRYGAAWATRSVLAALLAIGAGCGCKTGETSRPVGTNAASRPAMSIVPVLIKGKAFRLQVRSTDAARLNAVGQFPPQSEADGVLLAHPIIRPAHVYYYGAPMALEAVALDDTGRILGVETVIPELGEETAGRARFFGRYAARYVMLLPGGVLREAGAKDGDTVVLPPAAAKAVADAMVPVKIRGETFKLEVVASATARNQGLMRVPMLPSDVGMVFVFSEELDLGFWMEQTMIPLDIAYLNASGTVVSLKTMKPFDRSRVPSLAPAKYAIELPAGTAARIGLRSGDKLDLPPAITNPPDLE